MINSINSSMGGMPTMVRPTKEEMFQKADANGDGKIDADELNEVLAKASEMSGRTIDAAAVLGNADEDGDGALDQAEMDNAMARLREQMGPPPPPNDSSMLKQLLSDEEEQNSSKRIYQVMTKALTSSTATPLIDVDA